MDVTSFTAVVTPFQQDKRVDFQALNRLVSKLCNHNWGIILLGTTGERMSLSVNEEQMVMQTVIEHVASRIPVYVGAGCNCTEKSVRRAKLAKQLGADGILAIVPYYNRPQFRGIMKHFEAIAEVGLPVIACHHPKRTGVSLSIDELFTLSQIDGIEAIKESSGDLALAENLIKVVSVPVLCGDDVLT